MWRQICFSLLVIAAGGISGCDSTEFEGQTGKYLLVSVNDESLPHTWINNDGCTRVVHSGTLTLDADDFWLTYDLDIACPGNDVSWVSEFKGRYSVAGIELRMTRVVAFHDGSDHAMADMEAIILGDEITLQGTGMGLDRQAKFSR